MPVKLQGSAGPGKPSPTEDFTSSNSFVESALHRKLTAIADKLDGDAIAIISPMRTPVDDFIRDAVEAIPDKKSKLLVVLETDGGSIEVVERIADVLRHHYPDEVSFIVPNYAMSAGTVLVMCGDRIYMDYYSILGPIDPQVKSRTKGDVFVPALGYLAKYQQLIDKSAAGTLTAAEAMFLTEKFDPAELHQFEEARDLSIDLLKKWLVRYKFKNWTVTRTNGNPVTAQMKEDRAAEIAASLNETKRWKSHSRGLSMQVIEGDLNLQVDDLSADAELLKCVRSYYRLLQDHMLRSRHTLVIHTNNNYFGLGLPT